MSVLDRYKKSGGFVQLLTLIETSNTAKKEKFLQLILEESPDWHKAIKERILTLDIILQWPLEYLSELTSRSLPMTLAAISKANISEEQKKRLLHGLPHTHLIKIRDLNENKTFTPIEIGSSIEKFLSEVRTHLHQGVVKLEKFAPDLAVPDGIEEQLSKKGIQSPSFILDETLTEVATPNTASTSAHATSQNNVGLSTQTEDVSTLKRHNLQLQQELQILRQENKAMREKLDKIKKIA